MEQQTQKRTPVEPVIVRLRELAIEYAEIKRRREQEADSVKSSS